MDYVRDMCVVSNALLLKAYYPEKKITVDATVCAGLKKENIQRLLTRCHLVMLIF